MVATAPSGVKKMKLTIRSRTVTFSLSDCGFCNSSFKASMASSGMVNSAITSMDATVRNLAYIGT